MSSRPRVRRAASATALVLGLLLVAYLLAPLAGARQVTSHLAWIAAPALASWWGRPRRVDSRLTWPHPPAFFVTSVCWTVGNVIWGLYESVLDRPILSPSPADVFFVGALVAGGLGATNRLRALAGRQVAARSAVDGVLLGGSAGWVLWVVLLAGDASPGFEWIHPVLGFAAGSLCLAVMTRVDARHRSPWLLRAAAFLVVAAADSVWAYSDGVGSLAGGQPIDLVRVGGYLLVGFAARFPDPGPVRGVDRSLHSRWASAVPYPVLALALVVAGTAHGDLGRGEMTSLTLLGLLLVARQLLSVSEAGNLTRDLEALVAERTAELHQSESDLRTILQRISDVIAIVDPHGRLVYVSASVEPVLGVAPAALVGSDLAAHLHELDVDPLHETASSARADPSATASCDVRIQGADGQWYPFEVSLVSLDAPAGSLLATFRDVTERRALEARLRQQAYHDSLTGLANRSRLNEALEVASAEGMRPALLLLDLDGFKSVNDTAGHQLGDEVLVAVAARLRRSTRPTDLVVRLGGDEFAVLVDDDPTGESAMSVADRVLESLKLPITLWGRVIRCGASIGVATLGPGQGAVELVRDADLAMYEAKRKGRGRVERFTPRMHEAVVGRRDAEDRLRSAVDDDSFVLHYQPIVDLPSGRPVGLEALLRLPDGRGGLLPPSSFVPVAEETGLIVPLGAAVLRRACADAVAWQPTLAVGVSVNVSTRQLQAPDLVDTVRHALDAGLIPSLLTLEITEGALADDAATEATLHELRLLGVQLTVDDFGAGHSSLGRLQTLPVDGLKIDRTFVEALSRGGGTEVIEVVLNLGELLGLRVIAEGIETPEQAETLARRGCRFAQGYWFGEPRPVEAVVADLLRPRLMEDDATSLV